MFMRSSVAVARAAELSLSRLRCGDPEVLLSPDRFNRCWEKIVTDQRVGKIHVEG